MLDLRHLCKEPYAITIEDLEKAKKVNDKIQENDIVIIHTGWAASWGMDLMQTIGNMVQNQGQGFIRYT